MAVMSAFSNKLYLFVNVMGMVLGYTSLFLIGLYLSDELNYDRFHAESDSIYRVVQFGDYGGIVERSSSCPFPLGEALANDFPEQVSSVVRLFNHQSPGTQISYKNMVYNDSGFFYTDPSFFDIFTVDFIKGNSEWVLQKPYTAVITESAALRYFGYYDVLGKKLTIENQVQVEVVGVVKDWPRHAHFHFSVLVSMATLEQMWGGELPGEWVYNPCWTYVKVEKSASAQSLERNLPSFVQRNFPISIRDNNSLYLQPLADIHRFSNLEYEIEPNGSIIYVYVFGSIAFFLMLMSVINYINLTTATFASRAREIAVKKILGATVQVVRLQLIIEAMAISLVSIVLSLVVVELLLPWFNVVTLKYFTLSHLFTLRNLGFIAVLVLLVSFVGGLYPALFISALQPSRILRGNFKRALKSGLSRKILVVAQLFISTLLIYTAFTINRQYHFMLESDNGITRDNLLVISARFTGLHQHYFDFKTDLERSNAIESVTASDYVPGIDHNRHPFILNKGTDKEELVFFPALYVMSDFGETYGLEFIAGRGFRKYVNDEVESLIINNEMTSYLGGGNAAEFVGQRVSTYGGNEQIVGVFGSFYPRTLINNPDPFIIDLGRDEDKSSFGKNFIAVRYKPQQKDAAIEQIRRLIYKYVGKKHVRISAYADIYRDQYSDESLFNMIAGVLSLLSLIISAVGLLGLTSFLITQKSRGISIRKVYGASSKSVIWLIMNEFVRVYVFAIIPAFPVAWYLGNLWLEIFALRVDYSPIDFLFAAALIAIMIFAVAVFRMREVANVNAAQILKYE